MADHDATGTMAREPSRAAPGKATTPGLVLVYAPEPARVPAVVPIARGSTVIGREPPPGNVTLALVSVSRVHARIDREGDTCTLHDLRSRNGVMVRGHAVQSAVLRPGDDVRIGDATFVFVADHAEAHAPTAQAPYPYAPIACGPATRRLFDALVPIARSTIAVLVHGETGTGKELVAEAIHRASGRTGALRAVNCAAIPPNLVESELFGFKKGAFSGADRDRPGIVRAAHGGTLFLDEIGDLPLDVQPKLLRLLESNEIAPVGSAQAERVDVRFVCATHADLEQLVAAGRFRADLHSRIRGHVVTLPPLRDRKQDLQPLVSALLTRLERSNAPVSVAFMVALVRYDWPYNVRELFAVLRRAVALCPPNEVLDVVHLPDDVVAPKARVAEIADQDRPPVPSAEELRAALVAHDGNVAALARIYRRDRSLIHRWLKQHDLDPGRYRG